MRLRSATMLALVFCLSASGVGLAAAAASIKDMMDGTVDPDSKLITAIGAEVDPANGTGQTSDARWTQAAQAAAELKTVANDLQRRGVAKDRGLWMSDAKLLGATAAAAERAALAKNGMDFSAAATTLGPVCSNCHTRYSPDVPN